MWASVRLLAVYLLLGIPASIVGITWSAIRRDFSTMYGWGMAIVRLGVKAAGIKVRVIGLENLPAQPSILMSNHVSNLDPPVLLPSVPGQTSVMLKKSLMKIPLLGTAMRMGKYVPVSRGHAREDAVKSVAAAADALRSGMHITIFPEGTRSPDGRLLPFRKGAFFLATETGAPIVPVVIHGTARMMPRDTWKITPGTATVQFLPARRPGDFASRDALACSRSRRYGTCSGAGRAVRWRLATASRRRALLLHNRVVAVREQALTHRVRFFLVVKRAHLDVDKAVRAVVPRGHGVASGAQRPDQQLGIFLVRHRRDLHHVAPAGSRSRR